MVMNDYTTMRRKLIAAIGCSPNDDRSLSDLALLHAQQLRRFGDGSPASVWMIRFASYIDNQRAQKETPAG